MTLFAGTAYKSGKILDSVLMAAISAVISSELIFLTFRFERRETNILCLIQNLHTCLCQRCNVPTTIINSKCFLIFLVSIASQGYPLLSTVVNTIKNGS